MSHRRSPRVVLSASLAAAAASAAIAVAAPVMAEPTAADPTAADLSAQDQQFLKVVKELDVPVNSNADAIAIGQEICKAVDAGRIEPARTVRGVMSRLQAQGLDKKQSVNLVWGAVASYCPQYNSIVGR